MDNEQKTVFTNNSKKIVTIFKRGKSVSFYHWREA